MPAARGPLLVCEKREAGYGVSFAPASGAESNRKLAEHFLRVGQSVSMGGGAKVAGEMKSGRRGITPKGIFGPCGPETEKPQGVEAHCGETVINNKPRFVAYQRLLVKPHSWAGNAEMQGVLSSSIRRHAKRSTIMALKRFTKPRFLEQIGRGLLKRLLEDYRAEFDRDGVALPADTLADRQYYVALSKLALAEQGLPEGFIEALYGIEAMANEQGKARLMGAVAEAGLTLENIQEATHADFAVQVLLASAALFGQKLDEMRIGGLSSFEYYGSVDSIDRRATFAAPGAENVALIKQDIDTWLTGKREGDERVTEVEAHGVDGEHWFLIRRGEAFARIPTVEGTRFTVRHLRPARDLVVVYSPERDELRVHAKGVGERKMLRRVFGQRLMGDPDYFCLRKAFTLWPLRVDGADALVVIPGGGIEKIILTGLRLRSNDEHEATVTWAAKDLFAYSAATGQAVIPAGGELVSAGFQVYFTGHPKPRMIYLRAGNRLRLTRQCDAAAVHRWLAVNGFRSPEVEVANPIQEAA